MTYARELFCYDSKGKVRSWFVTTVGADVIVSHGLLGGKVVQQKTTAKAKNIGKANETTPEEQAQLEAQSKWNKQVDREDYHWDVTQSGQQLRPMLARDFLKVPHQVDFTEKRYFVQPKLDGLRLIYGLRNRTSKSKEFLTRKGESYALPHLEGSCGGLFEVLSKVVNDLGYDLRGIDGEVYLHGTPLGKILGASKKFNEELTPRLEFHVFDLVVEGMPLHQRIDVLELALDEVNHVFGSGIKLVESRVAYDLNYVECRLGYYVELGYEGIMIRDINSLYHMGERPDCLFKYKKFIDEEFQIVNVWPDENGNAMLTLANPKGDESKKTFDCTPMRTHDERKLMLEEDLVGKWIKVKFQGWTEYGVPQFPVGLEIRECDEDGNPVE